VVQSCVSPPEYGSSTNEYNQWPDTGREVTGAGLMPFEDHDAYPVRDPVSPGDVVTSSVCPVPVTRRAE